MGLLGSGGVMVLNAPSSGPGGEPGVPAGHWADPPGGAQGVVRQDILSSWQRCLAAGLRPDHFEVPYQPDMDDDGPLRWAAAPILDQVAGELEGTGVGLLLTDARGQVVDRRAADTGILTRLDRIELAPGFLYGESLIGTNAIGTAIAQQAPSVVTGSEHFADALTSMACAATPITDGAGEMIGVVDLTCAAGVPQAGRPVPGGAGPGHRARRRPSPHHGGRRRHQAADRTRPARRAAAAAGDTRPAGARGRGVGPARRRGAEVGTRAGSRWPDGRAARRAGDLPRDPPGDPLRARPGTRREGPHPALARAGGPHCAGRGPAAGPCRAGSVLHRLGGAGERRQARERPGGNRFRRGWPGRASPVGPRRRSGRRRPGRLGADRPAGAGRSARRHAEADQPARPRHQCRRQAARRGPLIPADPQRCHWPSSSAADRTLLIPAGWYSVWTLALTT